MPNKKTKERKYEEITNFTECRGGGTLSSFIAKLGRYEGKKICLLPFAEQTATCYAELVSASKDVAENSPLTLTLSRKGRGNKVAFTLAEVLITLGIIGVVAALLMPSLIANVTERVNSYREANIALKITHATDKMRALGLLDGSYKSTDEFVDVLQKHLKIAKRCDAAHIAECWPTSEVMTTDGEEYQVKKAKTGRNLQLNKNKTDNVGLILADGAAIILSYNQDASALSETGPIIASNKTLPVGFGKTQNFAYTTNSTNSIDFVMDVNGGKGPNSETVNGKFHDIRSFRVARFSKGCTFEVPGVGCAVNIGVPTPINTCDGSEYLKYDSHGSANRYCSNNYWAGVKKACDDAGMIMPDTSTMSNILRYNGTISNLNISLGDAFWTSTEGSDVQANYFTTSGNGTGVTGFFKVTPGVSKNYAGFKGICLD